MELGGGQLEGGLAEAEDQVEQERNLKQSTDMSCRKPGPLAAQKGAQFRGGARGDRGMASNQTQGWDWRSNQLAGAPRPEAGGQEPAVQPRGLGAWWVHVLLSSSSHSSITRQAAGPEEKLLPLYL